MCLRQNEPNIKQTNKTKHNSRGAGWENAEGNQRVQRSSFDCAGTQFDMEGRQIYVVTLIEKKKFDSVSLHLYELLKKQTDCLTVNG